MPPRRGAPSINTLSPPDVGAPSQSPPGFLNFPRSASPSTGFSQFLSKPTKWFNRSTSSGNVPGRSSIGSSEPRSSTSSGSRKPKISHPTDPRPILDKFNAQEKGGITHHTASRSVLDLSLGRTTTTIEHSPSSHTPRTPSSPSQPAFTSRGLGDLRNISRKPWSKSADDLGKVSVSPTLTPIDTTFQGKIEQYRTNRADSVSSAVPSPATSPTPSYNQKNYPFPSSSNTDGLSTSPPHKLGPLSSAPSPISGTPPLTPSSASGGQVHSRSHSFTPKLPSKLSAPKLTGLVPTSPKRKGSASSEIETAVKERVAASTSYDRDKNSSGGSIGAGPSARPGFPFNLGGGSNKSLSPLTVDVNNGADKSAPNSALLAPPQIIEPGGDEDSQNEKRTSQVVFHSGFINRLADFSPQHMNARAGQAYTAGSGGLMLAKGWKPFKLVLKGSKLYFYKPPNDRANAVRDLFPTELVVILEEQGVLEDVDEAFEGDAEEFATGRGQGKDRDRKRAYWGRNTHPGLVCEDGVVQKGSVEALIHEAVFSTTFLRSTDPESSEHSDSTVPVVSDRYDPAWQDFSSTILLSLPSSFNRTDFETEFIRCCGLLLDGAEDDQRDEEVSRVIWLANQYLSYFGHPKDVTAWEAWRSKSLPDVALGPRPTTVPQSSSTQAMYAVSPQTSGTEFSPDLGAFSPRPEHDRIMSLVDALGNTTGMKPPTPKAPKVKKPWQIALGRTGLTREVLLSLDQQAIARSLCVFHEGALQKLPLSITADTCLDPAVEDNGGDAISPLEDPDVLKPFVGNDEQVHWLTKTVLLQILISDTPGRNSSSGGPGTNEGFTGTSRTHSRSEVISAWARIGEICRRTGDECSWKAIFNALCSRPIARLDKVWKRVDGDAVRAVHSWVYPNESGEIASTSEAKTVPWAGDHVVRFKQALEEARVAESNEFKVGSLSRARRTFETLRMEMSLCSRQTKQPNPSESEDVTALAEYWQSVSEGNTGAGMAAKFTRIDQFMALSLAAEPRRKGAFEPYFWVRAQQPTVFHPLLPVLFIEPLPAIAFVNRALLPRGRLDSAASAGYNQYDIQYARELNTTYSLDRRPQPDRMNPLDLGGTTIVLYEGELTLLVQPGAMEPVPSSQPSSRAPSRPPSSVDTPTANDKGFSRAPSMRVKPGANSGLERKTSQLRRSSLPSLARKPSFMTQDVGSDRPLRVVVKAGTLERLVDILVEGLHGISVSVADDNGEISLNAEKTRELRVDVEEYASVWWHTFRSFVTPNVFFELLRKRYMNSQPRVQTQSATNDLASAIRVRLEVLEAISKWITTGGGAQDALDDSQLYTSLMSFLSQPAELPPVADDAVPPPHGLSVLEDTRRNLLALFSAQQRRPLAKVIPPPSSSSRSAPTKSFGPDPPDIDQIDPETLVSNLDAMAAAAFRNVIQEDLFTTADILEVQSADRTGWFPVREPNSISDEVEIQYIHSYLLDVEPSTLISELGQDSLYRLLPPAVRGCIRAFGILRKWLMSKITAQKIGLRVRHNRMDLYLRAIEVCRIRNAIPGDLPHFERPCVRSFVETILTSAVLSVESRMYHRAWQIAATTRGTSCDSLSSLLSKPIVTSVSNKDSLTTDMGWLIEKILEVISMPDVMETPPNESPVLINFDKRRTLCGFITSNAPLSLPHKSHHRVESSRIDFERLNNIEQALNNVQFDLRVMREEAHRELTQAGPPMPKRPPRPFQAIVAAQQEKNKRDKSLRDRLSKEKRLEQQRLDKREEYLNKAMNPRRPPPAAASKQHRNKKSMSSAFLHFMRPISSAFTSDTTGYANAVKRTPAELDFTPTQKPSLVLNVVDARVSQFINNERSFTFQIDTEDGGHYLLQALDKSDMKKWMDTIERVSKSAAKRRLTYLGNASKIQASDHLLTPGNASRDPRAVFGVELEYLLRRDAGGVDPQPGSIPVVVDRLIAFVETKGLTDIGIYRIAGAHSEINSLKDALNRGEWPINNFTDVNAVCDLIKSWFRVLPGGLFPGLRHSELMAAASNDAVELETRLSNVRAVVHSLPDANFSLLRRLMEHLDRVTDYEEHNQMTADSLSTVFSPNLLRSSNNDIGFFFANMSAAHRAVKLLITHFHSIFDYVEPGQEVDSDTEEEEYEHFDEPIPEEDEEEDILSAKQDMSDEEEEDGEGVEQEDEDRTYRYPAVSSEPPRIDIEIPHIS
ncbi:hypothetical protein BXZ70DRAFT_925997 [Cristinia sonorae]|uniref:Rho GTPase activating protein 22 n=1 Tax=Cristinia sonorae TaxID=1940300 RepID=A0A8K0UUE0_9AGAR|nr:hypothetical protein BXZ70DRAFT_925997 [Cristinia sonorae]